MRPAGTSLPITTSCQPRRVNRSRTETSRSGRCPRASQRTAAVLPSRATANVAVSPSIAPSVATSSTSGSDRCGVVIATAAAAPTSAPVGTTGTIDPMRTPRNSVG